MTYRIGRDPVPGRVWDDDPSLVLSAGPSHARAAEDDDPPYVPPRIRLGFAPASTVDPLTWEGDNA